MTSDWDEIARWLAKVAEGEQEAWEHLLVLLSPRLEELARRQKIGRLRNDEDVHRDIVTKVIGRLHANEHRSIVKWASKEPPPPVEAWVRVLVRSAAIDVMRGRPEFHRGGGEREHGWFSLATLVTRDGMRAPDTLAAKQREVERFMSESVRAAKEAVAEDSAAAASSLAERWRIPVLHTRRLVKKVELYEPILQRVLGGQSYPEIASALELSRREVELVVGYIEELFHARGFAA